MFDGYEDDVLFEKEIFQITLVMMSVTITMTNVGIVKQVNFISTDTSEFNIQLKNKIKFLTPPKFTT
jgi:hypothetical protein